MKLVVLWPRRQPRQVGERARALWAVGRFSTGGGVQGARGREIGSCGYEASSPLPPTWRGVDAKELLPAAWGGLRPALGTKTTTPSPPARAGFMGGRTVLHGAKRARAARHGVRTLWPRNSHPTAAVLARCWSEKPRPMAWGGTRRALAAKTTTPSPLARACSLGSRPVFHEMMRARAAWHGVKKR